MKAQFAKKKYAMVVVWAILCAASIAAAVLSKTNKTPVFIFFGALFLIAALFAFFHNRNAYLDASENGIVGKYGLFGKINCKADQIKYVETKATQLIILLENNKRYQIYPITNASELLIYISKVKYRKNTEDPDKILNDVVDIKKSQRIEIFFVVTSCVLLFVFIFLAVFLTGDRKMGEFSNRDWLIFAAFSVCEIATVIFLFKIANVYGKKKLNLEERMFAFRHFLMESSPVPTFTVSIFAEAHFYNRVYVAKCDDSEKYYAVTEELGEKLKLREIFRSKPFDDPDEILDEVDNWIRIK